MRVELPAVHCAWLQNKRSELGARIEIWLSVDDATVVSAIEATIKANVPAFAAARLSFRRKTDPRPEGHKRH